MEKYKLQFKASVAKDLRNIPNADVNRILKRIDLLTQDPRPDGCIKLSGHEQYRLRQGMYRILYEIHDQSLLVCVVKIASRGGVYKP